MDNYEQWEEMIGRAARSLTRDYPDSEEDDIRQEIWVFLLESQQKGDLLEPHWVHSYQALRRAGQKFATKERQNHLTMSPQYNYRTKDVRKLLENFFDKAEWPTAEVPEEETISMTFGGEYTTEDGTVRQRFSVKMDPSTQLDMMSDLSRAWDKLPDNYQTIIRAKFKFDDSVDSKKLSRAIARMADLLNKYEPRSQYDAATGTRSIWSNARCRYEVSITGDD